MARSEFTYQVTFCDTKYLHRYINFEVDSERSEDFDKVLESFVENMKAQDNSILMSKVQQLEP